MAGVGASAGGLEAFSQLLEGLPPEPGLAIVLVQHLAPQHESALATLLSSRTDLPVVQATEGVTLEKNRVYVIPPNVQMDVRDGSLHLSPRPSDRSQYTPIDFFLRSLAECYHDRAIAVILSGTASDGTLGVRDVKAAGGITIAQQPETAKYDGMPRAAIATGLIDLVIPAGEIARELVRIAHHPRSTLSLPAPSEGADAAPVSEENLDDIFLRLRSTTGVDFRRYKRPTIQRRLQRRMVLHKLTRIEQYLKLLRDVPGEVNALYQDILIHVTRFFRDPDSFAAIAEEVLPRVTESKHEEQPVRVWVPGCSTGEEAYSIAIVLLEFLGDHTGRVPVQIFATDVSESAIEHARAGVYAETITADVTPARLRRFFSRVDGGYKVGRAVRDLVVFARQDLTRDPPFSNLDLIVCRNVLIYLGPELQKKLIGLFHYALRPTGFLVLGSAETIGLHTDMFAVSQKKHRIYEKRFVGGYESHVPVDYAPPSAAARRDVVASREQGHGAQAEANRVIQDRYAPPGVIVDENLHVVQFRGRTGAFLEPAPGEPSLGVLKMAREGLLHGLRSALQEARRTKAPARRTGVRFKADGGWRTIDVEVLPLPGVERPHYLVLFPESRARIAPAGARAARQARVRPERDGAQVTRLQEELASSREYLQSIIQELEAANEELQSANEEVLSANEELQSTNEELDTAKEELQSTNEELNTVNDELQARNDELNYLNSDLTNLLASVHIAIVIVTSDLRIRRFTSMAERVLNLIPTDVGRPIGHIKPNIDVPDLEEQIGRVIDSVTPCEQDVQDRQGNTFSLRIRPYKNVENRIDGAVLTLFDVQGEDRRRDDLRKVREYATTLAQTVRQPLAIIDGSLRVRGVNRAFAEALGVTEAESDGRYLHELGDGQWNGPQLRALLEDVLRDGAPVEGFQLDAGTPQDGKPPLTISVRRVGENEEHDVLLVLAVEELSLRPAPGVKP